MVRIAAALAALALSGSAHAGHCQPRSSSSLTLDATATASSTGASITGDLSTTSGTIATTTTADAESSTTAVPTTTTSGSCPESSANLIQNPSFEDVDGSTVSWEFYGGAGYIRNRPGLARTGHSVGNFPMPEPKYQEMFSVLQGLTPGQQYQVTFWYRILGTPPASSASGECYYYLDVPNANSFIYAPVTPAKVASFYQRQDMFFTALGRSHVVSLSFSCNRGAGQDLSMIVDDFRVSPTCPVTPVNPPPPRHSVE